MKYSRFVPWSVSMKASVSVFFVNRVSYRAAFAVLIPALLVITPAYGQIFEQDRMIDLYNESTSALPVPVQSSRTGAAAVQELATDGGFEGGYYGGSIWGAKGLTGPWSWYNGKLSADGSTYTDAANLSPIWQNQAGVNAHTGQFMAYFNPFGASVTSLSEMVNVPTGATGTLSFWLKIVSTSSSQYNPSNIAMSDRLVICFLDHITGKSIACPAGFLSKDSVGGAWANYTVPVPAVAIGPTVDLLFQTVIIGTTIFQLDDISLTTGSTPSGSSCTENAFTMCLVNGRYRVTSHWKNQYAGSAVANLSKANLTDKEGAFWIADASSHEYLIKLNTATNNGRVWIAITTFTDVEFWVAVTDTVNGQSKEYHSNPGNQTLIYDPSYFVYP